MGFPAATTPPTLASLGVARGQVLNTTANLTVVTGLGTLTSVVVAMAQSGAFNGGHEAVIADLGDQVGNPAAGSFILRSLQDNTLTNSPGNSTGSSLNKKVNWVAFQ